MSRTTLLLLILAACCWYPAAQMYEEDSECKYCGLGASWRSSMVEPENYPWAILLLMNETASYCAGALITKTFVLTAAHCLYNRTSNEVSVSRAPASFGPVPPQVLQLILHPEYDPERLDNDIGLLRLSQPVTCDETLAPICLPRRDVAYYGSVLQLAAWGKRRTNTDYECPRFSTGFVHRVHPVECLQYLNDLKEENILCTKSLKTKQTICEGDSGSSIFARYFKVYYTFGVASAFLHTGDDRCNMAYPSLFTKTFAYLKWIRKNVGELPSPVLPRRKGPITYVKH